MLKFLLGLLVTLPVLAHHHLLYLFPLLHRFLQVPFLGFKGLVLLADGLYFRGHFFDLLLEKGNAFIALFANFFDLFLKGLDLILVELSILLCQGHLHLLFDLQHLDLLYHGIEPLNQLLLLFQIEGFLSDADLACLDLLHHFDLLISIQTDLGVFLFDFTFGDQQSRLEFGDWLVVVQLDLALLDTDLHL